MIYKLQINFLRFPMQVFPAAAVKGNSEKDNAEEEPVIQKDPYPPMIAFSPFAKTRSCQRSLKRRAGTNRRAEVKREVKTAGREPRVPSPAPSPGLRRLVIYPTGETLISSLLTRHVPRNCCGVQGTPRRGFFVPPPTHPPSWIIAKISHFCN